MFSLGDVSVMRLQMRHTLCALGVGVLSGVCLGQVVVSEVYANELTPLGIAAEQEAGDDISDGEEKEAGEAIASPASLPEGEPPKTEPEPGQLPTSNPPDPKTEVVPVAKTEATSSSAATPPLPTLVPQSLSATPTPTTPAVECGEIYSWRPIGGTETRREARVPIEDCADPFGVDTDGVNYFHQLIVDRTEITTANELVLDGTKPRTLLDLWFQSTGRRVNGNWSFSLYRHDENGFEQIFHQYVITGLDTTWHVPQLAPGEYAAVLQFNPIQYVGTLIPHDNMNVSVQYFSVTHNPPEPPPKTGVPSVLFLPGIQSTRLHQSELLFDDTLWPPSINGGDVSELQMTEAGESVERIYVIPEDVIDRVSYPGIADIIVYEGFLQYLDEAEAAGEISSWYAYAYDWRYDVFTVVAEGARLSNGARISLLDQLQAEAAAAENGKATIIAHSNGGLLTKALMIELEQRCSDGEYEWCPETLVDRIVLIGSPQLGTPKAIQSVLHGDEVVGMANIVYKQHEFRTTARNFPMAYDLLPFDSYFAAWGSEPLVTFPDASVEGNFLIDEFPAGINSPNRLDSFVSGGDGRLSPGPKELHVPLIGNVEMMRESRSRVFDQWGWRAPLGVSVHEVVGVGQTTVRGIDYLPFPHSECTLKFFACEERAIWKPVPRVSLDGDQTVMAISAAGYDGAKETVYFDMEEYNRFAENENLPNVSHANLTEPPVVQQYLKSLLARSKSNAELPEFLSPDQPDFSALALTEHSIHSPAHLLLEDEVGRRSGLVPVGEAVVVLEEIPNSSVSVVGGSSYVYVPQSGTYTVSVSAYDQGVVSLMVRSISGDGTTELKERLLGVPVATGTTLSYSAEDGVLSAPLLISDETATTTVRWSWTGATSSEPRVIEPVSEPVSDSPDSGALVTAPVPLERDSAPEATRVGERRVAIVTPEVQGISTSRLSGEWLEIYQALAQLQAVLDQLQPGQIVPR